MATTSYPTAGTFSHTTDAGVTSLLVRAWGGGGKGGATSGIGGTSGGGGGAGGQFCQTHDVSVTGSTTYTNGVVVAAAGTGAGNQSYFSTTGAAPTSTTQGALAKGGAAASTTTAGTGSTTGGIGDIVRKGGNGSAGGLAANGAGGGGAGTTGDGGNASGTTGGTGTAVGGGDGGTTNTAGNAAGGGGGGAAAVTGTAGNGAIGRVDVIEVYEVNKSESMTLTENILNLLTHYINVNESTVLSESTKFTIVYPINVSDTFQIYDDKGVNILTDDNYDFEAGIGAWAGGNISLTSSTEQANTGTHSLRIECTLAGSNRSVVSDFIPVTGGVPYKGTVAVRTAATARTTTPVFIFYDASFVAVTGLLTGTAQADSSSQWKTLSIIQSAPTNAAYVRFLVFFSSMALAEVHYIDTAYVSTSNVNVTLVHNPTVSDSMTFVEDHKEELVHLVNVSESMVFLEALQFMLQHYINETEAMTFLDSVNVTQVQNVTVSDSMTFAEAVAFTLVLNAAVSDSMTFVDSVQVIQILLVSVSDSMTFTEAIAFTVVMNVGVSDTIGGGSTPVPVSPDYVLLTNGKLAVLVADISPYPLYQEL